MNNKPAELKNLIETVEKELLEFALMVKTSDDGKIIIHQDYFDAEQEKDFLLLGMATKYAWLYGCEITIVPSDELEAKLSCPNCKTIATVYHFAWSAIQCQHCNKMIEKTDWEMVF